MAVQHPGSSSVLDLMPSTKLAPSPEMIVQDAAAVAAQKADDTLNGRGGKTPEEVAVMKALRKAGPVDSVGELAKRSGLGVSVTSDAVSRLVERGLVRRTDGFVSTHRRIAAV